MLYLAEVQKKSSFIGASKAEIKLLACQQADHTWVTVQGEEVIPSEEANNFNSGVLVLVDLTKNKQIQRPPQEAGRQLVSILQNFTRLLEKSKNQEEEIEQWKQSLTYQSQELNRREMEMETRLEQLHQIQEEGERLEQQRQQIELERGQAEKLRQETERNRQELEKAWEHLQGEKQRIEEQQTQQGTVLDNEQLTQVQELVQRLSSAIASADPLKEQLNFAFEAVNQEQGILDYHWQQLEEQRASAEKMQADVDAQAEYLHSSKQEWQQVQASVEQAQVELQLKQTTLELKEEAARIVSFQLENQNQLFKQIHRLVTNAPDEKTAQKIDLQALEKMPLGELQELVNSLQKDIEKFISFVNLQEEELSEKNQNIEELKAKIQQASEFDRLSLENELADEQDAYQMLDDTLGGQRRNLREREEFFNQHVRLLRRRQGISDNDGQDSRKIDLQPILLQLADQQQQKQEQLQQLENQIEQIRWSIQETRGVLEHHQSQHHAKRDEWESMEQSMLSSRSTVAEIWGKVNIYQEILQPIQDRLNEMRQKLEAIAEVANHIQQTGEYQAWAVNEMQQLINNLIGMPFS